MATVTFETREEQHLSDLRHRLAALLTARPETPACATAYTRSTTNGGQKHLVARRNGILETSTLCGRFFLFIFPERFDPKDDCQECRQIQENLA